MSKQKVKPKQQEVMTKAQVAEWFGVSLPTIDAWQRKGLLQAEKVGRKGEAYRFTEEAVFECHFLREVAREIPERFEKSLRDVIDKLDSERALAGIYLRYHKPPGWQEMYEHVKEMSKHTTALLDFVCPPDDDDEEEEGEEGIEDGARRRRG